MNKFRIVLALIALLSCGASAFAQFDNGDGGSAVGTICEAGRPCPMPVPGNGGGGPIDPSPYDPQPGYPHHGGGGGGHYPGPGPGYPGGMGDRREVYVGQYFRDSNIDLLRMLNLMNARGAMIESVEITTQPGGGYSELQLIANGYMEDSSAAYTSFVTLNPRSQLVIGQNLRNLLLAVRGKVYIERIAVNLGGGIGNPPSYPGPGNGGDVVVPGYINQTIYNGGNIDLVTQTGLMNYRGYRISSVTVYGSSQYQARVQLLANGMVMGNLNLNGFGGGQTVYPNMQLIVGQNLGAMNLVVNGQARIDRVEIRLTRY